MEFFTCAVFLTSNHEIDDCDCWVGEVFRYVMVTLPRIPCNNSTNSYRIFWAHFFKGKWADEIGFLPKLLSLCPDTTILALLSFQAPTSELKIQSLFLRITFFTSFETHGMIFFAHITSLFAAYNQQDAKFHNLFISVRRCTFIYLSI